MEQDDIDHVIWKERNRGNYKISIVARLQGPVTYVLRLENPNGESIDYMLSLDGFKELGKLCLALSEFCEELIIANEEQVEELQKLLTYENIQNFVNISSMRKKKS